MRPMNPGKFSVVSVLVMLTFVASAAGPVNDVTPAGNPVVRGEWHESITEVLAAAAGTGVPVVSFWSNNGCSRCTTVARQAVNTAAFAAWRQERKLFLVTNEGKTGLPGELYEWTRNAPTNDGDGSYPFLRIQWIDTDGTVRVDTRISGYPYRTSAQTLINRIERALDDSAPPTPPQGEGAAPVFTITQIAETTPTIVDFELRIPIAQTENGTLLLARSGGKLPTGLRAVIDQASQELIISGAPTRSGAYSTSYRISERRIRNTVTGNEVNIDLTVVPLAELNPAADSAIKSEGVVVDSADTTRITGTLALSVTRKGRASAKYSSANGNISFKGKNWTTYDDTGTVGGLLEKGDYSLDVTLTPDGVLSAVIVDPAYTQPLEASLGTARWSAAQQTDAYVGYYTATMIPQLAVGDCAPIGYSLLTVNAKASSARTGRINYAGRLANGQAISGSTTLQPQTDGNANFVIYTGKRTYTVAALITMAPYAAQQTPNAPNAITSCNSVESYWRSTLGAAQTHFDLTLNICGGYYDPQADLTLLADNYTAAAPLKLLATHITPTSHLYGTATTLPELDLNVTASSITIERQQDNPTRAKISLVRRTGIFKGSMRVPFALNDKTSTVSATYMGVLLPGLHSGYCDCTEDNSENNFFPFGLGAYWFKDRLIINNTPLSFTAGWPITIDKSNNEPIYR